MTTTTITFASVADRDLYLALHHPKRRGTNTCGFYRIKGGTLSVHCETVSVTVRKQKGA